MGLKKESRPNYKLRFVKRDRAIKIIKELSEFLRMLDLRESNILKTMIVRFAIESVEASQGSLILYNSDNNNLKYQDTYIYENNRIILENYNDLLKETDKCIRPGEGIVGESYIKGIPILVEDLTKSDYSKPIIGEIIKVDIRSVIAMPLQVNNEVVAVLEIANSTDKIPFTPEDVEIIMIIANFASTILENAELFSWAIHDSLTGLYNNHYFYKEISEEIERSKRYGRVFSLTIFDIDNFKHINDGYGHASGDKALKLLSDCIQKTIRKEVDIAARYGGDEFVVVLPNTPAVEGAKVCERLLNLVKSSVLDSTEGKTFSFTISMGISEFPKDGEEIHEIFEKADAALYKSKRDGKGRVSIYESNS